MTVSPASLSTDERIEVTHAVMELLSKIWRLDAEQCITLLGLPADTKPRVMKRYQESTPLPEDPEVMKRLLCLFDIQEALRTSFPFNANMSRVWLSTPNRWFNNSAPLQVMLDGGLEGIYKVRSHLDCTFNWV